MSYSKIVTLVGMGKGSLQNFTKLLNLKIVIKKNLILQPGSF